MGPPDTASPPVPPLSLVDSLVGGVTQLLLPACGTPDSGHMVGDIGSQAKGCRVWVSASLVTLLGFGTTKP